METMSGLYSVRDVARIFGLTESRVRYWAQTGFINPSGGQTVAHNQGPRPRGQVGRQFYTFRDLVAIRAAVELLERGIPLQRVRKSLQALREGLPDLEQPLSKLRVRSDGDRLVLAEGQAAFEPLSGQLVLDFEIRDLHSQVIQLLKEEQAAPAQTERAHSNVCTAPPAAVEPSASEPTTAYGWFLHGCACDDSGDALDRGLQAYARAIEIDPHLAAAHTNLGNLYYCSGDLRRARECYERARNLEPDQPQARYNLANLCEEEGEVETAIDEYRRAVVLDPSFADAHFNLALALERVGSRVQALDHWRRYVELAGGEGAQEGLELARERVTRLSASGE